MKPSVIPSIFLVLLFALALEAVAQPAAQTDENVISQRGSFRVMPLFQRWSMDNAAFSEFSSVVSCSQPVSHYASVSLSGAFGSASGDLTSLRGVTDVQLSGNYYLESAKLVFSLGAGFPSGKKKLTADEFVTSILLSNNIFRFQVPQFGTGFNLSPGIVWALPVNDDFVIGLGATFHYRGSFDPLENFGSYDPGEEASGTVGLDMRIDETSSLSADVLFTHFGTDKVDGLDVFASGDKIIASVQFRKAFNLNELLVLATYRTKAKSEIAIGNLLIPLNQRVDPNHSEIVGSYAMHFNETFTTQFSIEGRFFQQTTAPLSGFTLIGVGVAPAFVLSESVTVPLRLKYIYGSGPSNATLSGFDAGAGVVVTY